MNSQYFRHSLKSGPENRDPETWEPETWDTEN